MHKGRVLVVEDLPDVRTTLAGTLADEGYDVRLASDRAGALQLLESEVFHVAVLDVRLDEADERNRDGLRLMREIKERCPATAVIILTGYADVEMVREALQVNRDGIAPAHGFLRKSEMDQLPACVERALEQALGSAPTSVADLIAGGENSHVEFKSSMRWDYARNTINKKLQEVIARAIAGMLNGEGGTLLIGVADDGAVLGIERDLQTLGKRDVDGFQLALTDVVVTHLGVEHMRCIHSRFEYVDGRCVCVVQVERSPRPVFMTRGGELWVRAGTSARSLDPQAATSYVQSHWKPE
jgi:CheY-like chemotaxis protein